MSDNMSLPVDVPPPAFQGADGPAFRPDVSAGRPTQPGRDITEELLYDTVSSLNSMLMSLDEFQSAIGRHLDVVALSMVRKLCSAGMFKVNEADEGELRNLPGFDPDFQIRYFIVNYRGLFLSSTGDIDLYTPRFAAIHDFRAKVRIYRYLLSQFRVKFDCLSELSIRKGCATLKASSPDIPGHPGFKLVESCMDPDTQEYWRTRTKKD